MRHLFVFPLAIFVFSSVCAQDTLTVIQAVQRVLARHPAIEAASHNVRGSEARVLQSSSADIS